MGVRGKQWMTLFFAATVGIASVGLHVSTSAAADAKDDSAIAVIMKKAFKGAGKGGPAAGKGKPSLVAKAASGMASDDEVKSLLGYCQDLAKEKPPKGEQADWDERCGKMVKAVEALSKGDKTAGADLKAAANCKECHTRHKED